MFLSLNQNIEKRNQNKSYFNYHHQGLKYKAQMKKSFLTVLANSIPYYIPCYSLHTKVQIKRHSYKKRVFWVKKAISLLCNILNYFFVTICRFTATELKSKALFKTVKLCENLKMSGKVSK